MKYSGNFRKPLVKNGSATVVPVVSRDNARDFKQYNATAEDVIAMVNGAGFSVRYGKQTLGYYATERQALFEAGRHGATAYKIVRQGDPHRATQVVLVPLDEEASQTPTAAELIADKIHEQVSVGDAPLSPLAKQRVVMMLFNFCKDKQIAWESFQILYPMAMSEQFNRLWSNIESENVTISTQDSFIGYADSRGFRDIADAILNKNLKDCISACSRISISSSQFEELYNMALRNNCGVDEAFYDSVAKHIARESVERRMDGDIFRMLKNEPSLRAMAISGNEEGIIDHLQLSGYHRREAEEICSEIISLGKMISKI